MILVLVERSIKKKMIGQCALLARIETLVSSVRQVLNRQHQSNASFTPIFIILVVLHGGWVVAHWPPIWLTVLSISVRSALVICMLSGCINRAVVQCRLQVINLKSCFSWRQCC